MVDILELNQEDFPFALFHSVVNDTEPKTLDKSTATGCIDLEGIVGIKADHPLAAPKMVIPEEPEGLHTHSRDHGPQGIQLCYGSVMDPYRNP